MASIKELDPQGKGFKQLTDTFLKLSKVGIVDAERDYVFSRQPFVITCESWLNQVPSEEEAGSYTFCIDPDTGEAVDCKILTGEATSKLILLYTNPESADWSFPKRAQLQKCRGGEVQHTWYNRSRGTYYDEISLTLTFQTGNILPVLQGSTAVAMRPGHDNLYEFFNLLDQHALIGGSPNKHYIVYNSPLFPYLTIQGWFDPSGPRLLDSADDPYGKKWTISMSVHKTYPKISDPNQLRTVFRTAYQPNKVPDTSSSSFVPDMDFT